MEVAQATHHHITHSDLREDGGIEPPCTPGGTADGLQAKQVILGVEHLVQYKQLSNDIPDVQNFDRKEEHHQIVAEPLPTASTQCGGQAVLQAARPAALLPWTAQKPVHLVHNEPQGPLPHFRLPFQL